MDQRGTNPILTLPSLGSVPSFCGFIVEKAKLNAILKQMKIPPPSAEEQRLTLMRPDP